MMMRRGIALVTVLIMCTVLLIMVLALYVSSRGGLFSSVLHQREVRALYVAEAGLADTMEALEGAAMVPPSSTLTGTLAGGGTWRVEFNQTGPPYTDRESVCNLTNLTGAADSYRGAGTVPAASALIVVVARVGDVERVIEAIITRGSAGVTVTNALQSWGDLALSGDVQIDGIKALDDNTPVPGNVMSNSTSGTAVVWDQTGTANIAGAVKASGNVDLGTYTPAGGIVTGASAASFPTVNIPGTVASKSTSPNPGLPGSGTATLAAGDYYVTGPVTLNGDLVLNGANLYVDGPLTINGAVRGDGSIYINGDTALMGDASISANPDQNIALFSQGNVSLTGFDGTAYMDALAASDSGVATNWTDAKNGVATMNNLVTNYTRADVASGGSQYTVHDDLMEVLGTVSADTVPNPYVLKQLATRLGSEPPSSARDFLIARLNWMADFYSFGSGFGGDAQVILNYTSSGGSDVRGLMDAVVDLGRDDLWPSVVNISTSMDYDKLGSAQFQGLIYTPGDLVVSSDLTVIGAVMAEGSIQVQDGSRITFVEDFFDDPGGFGVASGTVSVETWFGR